MACPRIVNSLQTNMSLFSVVHDATKSSSKLNSDLEKISEWAFKWKMSFNPDPTKPSHEVIFRRKLKTVSHPSVTFNNNPLSLCHVQKYLRLILDSKLTFNKHIKHILFKVKGYCANSNQSIPNHQFLLFTRHLSVLISTTLMLFMTKVASRCFMKNLR